VGRSLRAGGRITHPVVDFLPVASIIVPERPVIRERGPIPQGRRNEIGPCRIDTRRLCCGIERKLGSRNSKRES
jgi:hypothetical protein